MIDIMPAAIANKAAILAAPQRIADILASHRQQQASLARQTALEQVVRSLPANQSRMVLFGETLWPLPAERANDYSYDQIRCACWVFRDYQRWHLLMGNDDNSSVGSCAQRIRLSMKWFNEYLLRQGVNGRQNIMWQVFALVQDITRLWERNPDGECRWSMYPHIEAQW